MLTRRDQDDPHMATYPLPIRPGVRGLLIVPEDLTEREAARLCGLITALALPDPPDGGTSCT